MEISIVTKKAFQAVGLPWKGTYAQAGAGELRHVLADLKQRYADIAHNAQPDVILGISDEHHEEGFSYLFGALVQEISELPDGMVSRTYPAQTYVSAHVQKGTNSGQAHGDLLNWIEENGYQHKQDVFTYLGLYSVHSDPFDSDPELTIMIPIHN